MASQTNSQSGSSASDSSGSCGQKRIAAQPQDVVLAATTLALTLSKGRNRYEIETLINLLALTNNTLQAILAQILINNRYTDDLEIEI